jgi:hypothetical protein
VGATSGKLRTFMLALVLCGGPAAASAQDFGVLESAETIDQGTTKLRVNPMFLFGREGQDDEVGVAATIGYGLTSRFDIEGALAFYDAFRFYGANAEYWLVRDTTQGAFDLSLIGGVHFGDGRDFTPDTRGFDLTFLASKRLSDRTEFYTALDFAFESITDDGFDESYSPVHLVPGFEYRVADDVDLVGEIGLGLNDEARHYVAAGIAIYLR